MADHDAKARAGHTLTRAGDAVGRVKQKAPEPVQNAVDATGEKLSPLLHQSSEKLAPLLRQGTDQVKRYRKQLLWRWCGAARGTVRCAPPKQQRPQLVTKAP